MSVLVTGGAGYIGSHTAKALALSGYRSIVIDDLSTGHAHNVKWGPLVRANISDTAVCALRYLARGEQNVALNLGTGKGASVMEVIAAVQLVGGHTVPTVGVGRRAGDPPILVARPERAHRFLKWKPHCSDLKTIVETAWRWHSRRLSRVCDD